MYYTGQDPFTREPVYTARELRDKRKQKALLLYWDPQHHDLAREALIEAGRRDLIGSAAHCLVPPATGKGALSIHTKKAFEKRGGAPAPKGRLGARGGGEDRGARKGQERTGDERRARR
jgi:hypothetical protein